MTIGGEAALTNRRDAFAAFVADVEPRLRKALTAAYGVEDGGEACAAAFAFAWERWDELREMENRAGYLFRVGQTAARKGRRRPVVLPSVESEDLPNVEPGLPS